MSRLPSKGIGFVSGCTRGSAITFFMPSSRTWREGQVTHENTTVSSSLRLTAIGNDVTLPSGTSSPQHSTTRNAPCSLNTTAAASACLRYASRLAVGTAATNPSTYVIEISFSDGNFRPVGQACAVGGAALFD